MQHLLKKTQWSAAGDLFHALNDRTGSDYQWKKLLVPLQLCTNYAFGLGICVMCDALNINEEEK